MYSVLLSRVECLMDNDKLFKKLKDMIGSNAKVAIFPWAFPKEIDAKELEDDYFRRGSSRYNRYINFLKKLGINEDNITICNCYSDSREKLVDIINNSDVLFLPGGNPEMFFGKVVHDKEILYEIKHYKGLVIGESAGACLQFKRYFITKKNNYYKYFSFYDGFGLLDDPFYIDVHSISDKDYLEDLSKVSKEYKKNIYAIYDDGALIVDRNTNNIEVFGNVDIIK